MNLKPLLAAVLAAVPSLSALPASAGQTINEVGALPCVNDKWDEKELEKGHKLVDYAGRCVRIPDDPAEPKDTADCVGKYEYMPDESWKGSGTCTWNIKSGDKQHEIWEEVRTSRSTRSSGPAAPANMRAPKAEARTRTRILTDTLSAGRYKGKMELPR